MPTYKTLHTLSTIALSLILTGITHATQANLVKSDLSKNYAPTANNKEQIPSSVQTTLYGSRYSDETVFDNSYFALFESTSKLHEADLKLGLNVTDEKLELNQLMIDLYKDEFEIQLGKFVTQVGVLDFFGNASNLNPLRIDYFDEDNINLRRQSSWMGQFNYYPDEDTTVRAIIAPFDSSRRKYANNSLDVAYESGVPFFLRSSGNENIDLIAEEVLIPVYENQGGREALESYVEGTLPENKYTLDTTTFLFDYFSYYEDAKVGLTYINGISNIPLVKVDEDLLNIIENFDKDERDQFLSDYFNKADNTPIKYVEYTRFNQLVLYGETSLNSFGLRAEISYRDKFPLINTYSKQFNVGIGIDHQGWVYNNLELQYTYMKDTGLKAYFGLWQLGFDKYHIGQWQWQLENTSAFAVVDDEFFWSLIPGLNFTRKNLTLKLKYLHHSQDNFSNDVGLVQMKAMF